MPMMPMDPAKAVSSVRPFLVRRLFRERLIAVRRDIKDFFACSVEDCTASSLSPPAGFESLTIFPSKRLMIRVA